MGVVLHTIISTTSTEAGEGHGGGFCTWSTVPLLLRLKAKKERTLTQWAHPQRCIPKKALHWYLLEQGVPPTSHITQVESPLLSINREHKTMVSIGHTIENTYGATEMEDDCMAHWLSWRSSAKGPSCGTGETSTREAVSCWGSGAQQCLIQKHVQMRWTVSDHENNLDRVSDSGQLCGRVTARASQTPPALRNNTSLWTLHIGCTL